MSENLLVGAWFTLNGTKVRVLDVWTDRGQVESQYGGWTTWVNRMVTVKSEIGDICTTRVQELKALSEV